MNIINEIDNLPDYMKSEDLKSWFFQILDYFYSKKIDKKNFIEGLWNLADRQWHTYKILDLEIKTKIERVLSENWEATSDYIESISGIVGMLGLENIYSKIKALENETYDTELKKLIHEVILEFGESVSDPYK